MPEIMSRQARTLFDGKKLANHEAGQRRTVVIQIPPTAQQQQLVAYAGLAINDTLATGQFIPAASRVLGARVSNGNGNAGCVLDIGLRKKKDGTVTAAAIASNVAITTATTNPTEASNGTLLAAGADNALTDDMEVYLTAKVAAVPAGQAVRVEVDYIGA